jgi:LPXTG-motif cell wall-anchored protein
MSLEGAGAFELRKEDNSYITTEKIPSGATCNINILYDASTSYIEENKGKYWEVRLKATLRETLDEGGFGVVSGIGIRTLIEFKMPLFIDVPGTIEKGKEFTVKVTSGNFDGTWREIPTDATVSFSGETKPINKDGYVTFIAPTTRENFTYDITAEGSKYLPDMKTVVTGDVSAEGNTGETPVLLFVGIGIVFLVVLVAVGYYLFKHKRKKELEDG